jgi:hypothetical protein
MIPNPRTAATALAVTDGCTTVGYIVECDGSYFAYGADQVLIEEFESQHAAVRSIPTKENTQPTVTT